jgi:hypothetical protein
MASVRDEDDAYSTSPEPNVKRRKLRRGARSCWDCKKRKVKCTFESTTDTVCITCRRRGAACVGQDSLVEKPLAGDSFGQLFERVVGVKALLEELVEKVGQCAEKEGNSAGLDRTGKQKSDVLTPFSDFPSTHSFALSVRAPDFMQKAR